MSDPNPAAIESLFDPAPTIIETHISKIFLSGDRAFKLKKAVKLPFIDFSTLALRKEAAERELRFNRRSAPDLYLGLRGVWRAADGRLRLDPPPGETVLDWLVEMRRFESDATLDRRLAHGLLTADDMDAVAAAVYDLHAKAERSPRDAFVTADDTARKNLVCFQHLEPAAMPVAEVAAMHAALMAEIARHDALLRQRGPAGFVRRCHGDLHLRNIAWIDGRPLLFDCLEFDDALAEIDTLYDIAFLVMDLLSVGRRDLANRLLCRYLELLTDDAGLALLPLYVSLRAGIRAHIAGLNPKEWPRGAEYLALAHQALQPVHPRLVVLGGGSGTGKTLLARGLAPLLPGVAGAVVVRSDVTRKALFGLDALQPLPPQAYAPEVSARVFAAMRARARALLLAGQSVILDAVHGKAQERAAAQALAAELGVPCHGLWLTAPQDVQIVRVEMRRQDASDADAAVVRKQQAMQPPQDWPHLDAGQDAAATLAAACGALGL